MSKFTIDINIIQTHGSRFPARSVDSSRDLRNEREVSPRKDFGPMVDARWPRNPGAQDADRERCHQRTLGSCRSPVRLHANWTSMRTASPPFAVGNMRLSADGRLLAYDSGKSKREVWVLENFLPAA